MNVRLLVIVVLVIFAHARGAYVASDARYKIQDLGVGSAAPVGINDLGEIVAQIVMSDGSRESVVGRPRQFAPIPVMGDQALATGINASGAIVGGLRDAGQGFLFQNGTVTLLASVPGAKAGGPKAINSDGEILGRADVAGVPHSVLWLGGLPIDLGTLGGDYCLPAALNNGGQVVGTAFTAASGSADPIRSGVLWDSGAISRVGTFGGADSVANDINDSRQVVGFADTSNGAPHAFVWCNGALNDLGLPAGFASSEAASINDRGWIVGGATTRTGSSDGFLWTPDGSAADLNDLVPPDSGWHLDYAIDINSAGEIVGVGHYLNEPRPFLLTPQSVPLPNSAALALTTLPLLVLCGRSFRRQSA